MQKDVEYDAADNRDKHVVVDKHLDKRVEGIGPLRACGGEKHRQHHRCADGGPGDQVVAGVARFGNDNVDAGEHDHTRRDQEHSANDRTRNAGEHLRKLWRQAVKQEHNRRHPHNAAGRDACSGQNADVLRITCDRQRTEQSGTDAAESLGHDALVDMLDAVNLIADGTGGGIIAD